MRLLLAWIGTVPTNPGQRQQCDRLAKVLCRDVPPTSAVTGQSSIMASEATTPRSRLAALADGAGVLGAVVAALCCAGTPFIIGGLAVLGLSGLRKDAILWPIMLASLAFALWGFRQGFRRHGNPGPLIWAVVGGMSLTAGVIVVHGFPAMPMIYGGCIALALATVWNLRLRRACTV